MLQNIKFRGRYLEGLSLPFTVYTVYTDDQTFQYAQISRLLCQRLPDDRKSSITTSFTWDTGPGNQNTQCDVLFRRSGYGVGLRAPDLEPFVVLRKINSSLLHFFTLAFVDRTLCFKNPSRGHASVAVRLLP